MAMSMPSENLQLLIAGYVLGDLSPEEAAAFEQLLAQDPAIAAEVAQVQKTLEQSYNPPEVKPAAHLRSTILAKAAAGTADGARLTPTLRRTLPWRGMIEAIAAVMIMALGLNNYRLWQAVQISQTQPSQYGTLTYALDATKPGSQAEATVIVNPNTLEARISVKNLPPLPPGKVYALWTVLQPDAPFTTDTKKAILTEVFEVDDGGTFSQKIAVPKAFRSKEWVRKVAVTIEDAGAPQNHTGNPIMITDL